MPTRASARRTAAMTFAGIFCSENKQVVFLDFFKQTNIIFAILQ